MLNRFRRLQTIPERLRFRLYPRIAAYRLARSTRRASQLLEDAAPLRVLIDNSVIANAVTHETKWITTGVVEWGGQDRVTGHMARVPVHSIKNGGYLYRQVVYLPGIAALAAKGLISLYQSAELRSERDRHPIGLYRGYSYFDFNIFGDRSFPSIDGDVDEIRMGWPPRTGVDDAQDQRRRLATADDPLFHSLHALLRQQNPNKADQDAWHIRTAEHHGLFCFLTMDQKLLKSCAQLRKKEPLKSLRTRILSPEDFSRRFGILPVPPRLLSYNDASWFVDLDQTMPGEKRRGRREYK